MKYAYAALSTLRYKTSGFREHRYPANGVKHIMKNACKLYDVYLWYYTFLNCIRICEFLYVCLITMCCHRDLSKTFRNFTAINVISFWQLLPIIKFWNAYHLSLLWSLPILLSAWNKSCHEPFELSDPLLFLTHFTTWCCDWTSSNPG